MIISHTGFQPLKEVWIGDCYPESWYSDFDNQAQDIFCKITQDTKKDLEKFSKVLNGLGVAVKRPEFKNKDSYKDYKGNLCKPPITPRDWALSLGDTLYIIPQFENGFVGFESTIDEYIDKGYTVKILDRSLPDPMCYLPFPSVVRVGKDLFFDCAKDSPGYEYFLECCEKFAKTYRVHVTHTGDHNDGIFCPVAPGKIFTTHYRKNYKNTFPGWEVFQLNDTTKIRSSNGHCGRWWVDGVDLQIYNKSVIDYAEKWIGNSFETIFEVNMLVVDEKNICVIAEDDQGCRKLEQLGFNVHVIDFSNRGFWDGGLHCLTLDIQRSSELLDYWPDRGSPGIYYYDI